MVDCQAAYSPDLIQQFRIYIPSRHRRACTLAMHRTNWAPTSRDCKLWDIISLQQGLHLRRGNQIRVRKKPIHAGCMLGEIGIRYKFGYRYGPVQSCVTSGPGPMHTKKSETADVATLVKIGLGLN